MRNKIIIIFLMFIFISSFASAIDYDNFETFVTFDNWDGSKFIDEFNNINFTKTGGSYDVEDGMFDNAVSVNEGNYLSDNMHYLVGEPSTVGYWLYTDHKFSNAWASSVDTSSLVSPRTVSNMRPDLGYNGITIQGSTYFTNAIYSPMSINSWHYYVVVFDGSQFTWYEMLDGSSLQVARDPVFPTKYYVNQTIDRNPYLNGDSSTSYTLLGDNTGGTVQYTRYFDDYFIYNGVLTTDEITNIATGGYDYVLTTIKLSPSIDDIYNPCNETITLSNDGVEVFFSWGENNGSTVPYTSYLNISNILTSYQIGVYSNNETNDTITLNTSFPNGVYNTSLYTIDVNGLNTTTYGSCSFNFCINDYERIISSCVDNELTITYNDLNNCPLQYDLPVDNNQTQSCGTVSIDNDYNMMILLFILLVFFIVLWYFSSSFIMGSLTLLYSFLISIFVNITYTDSTLFIGTLLFNLGLLYILIRTFQKN